MNSAAKYAFGWKESCKPGNCEVVAPCPAVQGGGLMAGRLGVITQDLKGGYVPAW